MLGIAMLLQNKNLICLVWRTCLPNRSFSVTVPTFLNQKFRKERGLPLNPNSSGVLIDSPDFSFLDGRLTPLSQGQRQRVKRQHEVKNQILALSKEIDFAVDRHKQMLIQEENKKQQILDGKLKPKGAALLQSNRG